MVFDKHHNGVPVAWVISSRNSIVDISKWMSTLFAIGKKERPDWHVKAFITNDASSHLGIFR